MLSVMPVQYCALPSVNANSLGILIGLLGLDRGRMLSHFLNRFRKRLAMTDCRVP